MEKKAVHKKTLKPREQKSYSDLTAKQAEELIVNLYNAGQTPAEIGMILRDLHGIPDIRAFLGKKVSAVLKEKGLLADFPRDLLNLISRSVKLQKHMQQNKQDFTAKRGYILTVSKIRRLAKYYIKKGRIPEDWRYTPEQAALLVKW